MTTVLLATTAVPLVCRLVGWASGSAPPGWVLAEAVDWLAEYRSPRPTRPTAVVATSLGVSLALALAQPGHPGQKGPRSCSPLGISGNNDQEKVPSAGFGFFNTRFSTRLTKPTPTQATTSTRKLEVAFD